MITRESLGVFPLVGTLTSAGDCFVFIDVNADRLLAGARAGYARHGRGYIMVRGPIAGFAMAHYATADAVDLDAIGDNAVESYAEYDPEREILISFTDSGSTFVRYLWVTGMVT